MNIYPPSRSIDIYQYRASVLTGHEATVYVISILADIFTLLYPIYLVYYFVRGYMRRDEGLMKHTLDIFMSVLLCFGVNISIQSYIRENRPHLLSGVNMIFSNVPNNSFPSDHAAVSLVFALVVLLRGYKSSDRNIKIWGYIHLLGSIVMCISRIAVGIHRAHDILVGYIVAIVVAYLAHTSVVSSFLDRYIYSPILQLWSYICSIFGINKLFGR